MWRKLRILILLLLLAFVALDTYFDHLYATDWNIPLRVSVYPISGDDSPVTRNFIEGLGPHALEPIESFFEQEAGEYGLELQRPVRFSLAPRLHSQPPVLAAGAGVLATAWWSLRARYWAWRAPVAGAAPDIKLFVRYHDPQRSAVLAHSLGLRKGLFGIVNLFADERMSGSNHAVLAHELLHTLGATDKYDPATNQPQLPDGYAEADRDPLYPQSLAELMGGRIPLSSRESVIPESLEQVIVGPLTAQEIGWTGR